MAGKRNYDPTDLGGQAAETQEQAARKRVLRQQEIGDLKWLMSSPRGRRIVWRWLDLSGPFRLTFNTNAMQMAFNEGNRNFGNRLLNEVMTLCPEQYPVMVQEQRDGNTDDGNGGQSN